MRKHIPIYDPEHLQNWPSPRLVDLLEAMRPRFSSACAALTAVLTGELGLTQAAKDHGPYAVSHSTPLPGSSRCTLESHATR